MSKVLVNETSLTAIGNAIRDKNGKSDKYKPSEMAAAIGAIETGGGGEGLPEEAFVITGSCPYRFSYGGWDWFIENYGDKITTVNLSDINMMFANSKVAEIPFDINIAKGISNLANSFNYCVNLINPPLIKSEDLPLPTSNYSGTINLDNLFSSCYRIREIPYDYFHNFGGEAFWEASHNYYGNRGNIFNNCYSLRELPDISMLLTTVSYYSTLYNSLFSNCYVLNEAINLPMDIRVAYTSNIFSNTFIRAYRLKNIIFKTQEDGTPYVLDLKSQTIDLTSYVGYAPGETYLITYNSGITADKKVIDDATYQALKNDADWFACLRAYSRYNHDSAVATINSLPDTSAYLATAGGTNTIKFLGASGELTDGGAINTLTEEEIAVATAKGWTVTLV